MRIWCFLFLVFILGGCSPAFEGSPQSLFSEEVELEIARRLSDADRITAYAKSEPHERIEIRNDIILARMLGADMQYYKYEIDLSKENKSVEFLSQVASTALTGTATTISSSHGKTVLSAVATGLTGVKSAYDENILREKTILIIQQQMRTRRKEVKAIILSKLSLSTSEYPLLLAMLDVKRYENAGTIDGAFSDLAQETGERLAFANKVEEGVFIHRFSPKTNLGDRIQKYYNQSLANKDNIISYLEKNHNDLPLPVFLKGGASQAQLLAMIRHYNIP